MLPRTFFSISSEKYFRIRQFFENTFGWFDRYDYLNSDLKVLRNTVIYIVRFRCVRLYHVEMYFINISQNFKLRLLDNP